MRLRAFGNEKENNVWETIKNLIIRLFGVKPEKSSGETERQNRWVSKYEDPTGINFTEIFASRLTTLAVTDATLSVNGDSRRAALIYDTLSEQIWNKKQSIVAAALGCGGIMLIPYISDNRIYIDTVTQNRICINETRGGNVTKCTVIASYIKKGTHTYIRLTDHSLENGVYVIKSRAVADNVPVPLSILPEWATVSPEIRIANVKRLPVGYLRCPKDNRRPDSVEGVPITFGCEEQIKNIEETLSQAAREYKLKSCFVGVDDTMLGPDKKLPSDGLFKTFRGDGDGELWHEFSPEIRSSAYAERIKQQFELLEKQVGTSKGILTVPEAAATATEVRRGQYDTFALISAIRNAVEKAINDVAYAVDVLANYANLSPSGKYEVKIDWDLSLLEDSAQTWQQMRDAQSIGAMSKAELRAFLTNENLEKAQSKIDEIRAKEPSMADLIGEG